MANAKQVALITGTNSNLGMNIAYRLVEGVPETTDLTLIVTSRTLPRVQEVISTIKTHVREKYPQRTGRLEFDYLLVDFTDMVSVLSAYYDLNKKYTKIDYFFVNAAQGVFSHIDFVHATKDILRNPVQAASAGEFKVQRVGVKSADGLGLVFQANVFGPYYLLRRIRHLLQGGKVVWISSHLAVPGVFSFDDFQLLRTSESYESSKRLMDLVFAGTYKRLKEKDDIEQYLVSPGVFASYSFNRFLTIFSYVGMFMMFYFARFCGSQLHNISGHNAANAPVACALGSRRQDLKHKSATDFWGKEYLDSDEIDTTGAEDAVAYMDKLADDWDTKLKDQIADTRQP